MAPYLPRSDKTNIYAPNPKMFVFLGSETDMIKAIWRGKTLSYARKHFGRSGLEADLWAHPKLRYADNLRRAHARQLHLQPADVAAEVLRGRSAEWLDELFVAGVERVHVLDVIAA